MCLIRQNVWIGIAAIIIMVTSACKRDDFTTAPVGEAVPFTDTVTVTLKEGLAQSPYTFFYNAWVHSNMDRILLETGDLKGQYTLLVPTNAAMDAAGWNDASIPQAIAGKLDTFLMRYVFLGRITAEELMAKPDSYMAESLLAYGGLWYQLDAQTRVPYHFRAAMAISEDKLSVNDKVLGIGQAIPTKDGYIWPISGTVAVPTLTAWEALLADARFSLYTKLILYTDGRYREMFESANGYPPSDNSHPNGQAYNRNSLDYYDMSNHYDALSDRYYSASLNTWFIPTDDAFRQAGFNTLEDLIAFNMKRGGPSTVLYTPFGQEPYYGIVGEFATDTLLDYHDNWGRRIDNFTETRNRNPTLFFNNDLKQPILNDYPIAVYTRIVRHLIFPMTDHTVTTYHRMPLEFLNDGRVRVISSTAEPAGLVGEEIYSVNGVIHAVDHLLLPTGYLMD
ncbi:hypothetical protein SAMN05216436_10195 [bacterium A37T11]|nr:hypothetical protein SAMN05216436_10195 [bacterium A37T11]